MTVSSPTARENYTGTGAVDTYAYGFKIFSKTHLNVVQRDDGTGLDTTLVVDVDYTVTGVGDDTGGNIVLTAGNLPVDDKLSILRDLPLTQNTDIRNQGPFNAEVHEDEYDRGVMISQQQQDKLDRAVHLSEVDAVLGFNSELPTPEALKVWRVNAAGDAFDLVELGDIALAVPGDLTVTTAKIVDDAVTAAKINADVAGDGLVQGAGGELDVNVDGATIEIDTDTVRVKDAGIVTAKLGPDAVDSTKLADNAVGNEHLQALAVGTAELAALAVTTAKLGADAVDATKLADNAVGNEHLQNNAVDTLEIVDAAVATAKLDTATGSDASVVPASAGVLIVMNDYGFFPRVNVTAGTAGDIRMAADVSAGATTVGEFLLMNTTGTPRVANVRWRYVTGSDNPRIYIQHAAGVIERVWESEDPATDELTGDEVVPFGATAEIPATAVIRILVDSLSIEKKNKVLARIDREAKKRKLKDLNKVDDIDTLGDERMEKVIRLHTFRQFAAEGGLTLSMWIFDNMKVENGALALK